MKKYILFCSFIIFLTVLFVLPTVAADATDTAAENYDTVPDEYSALLEQIPGEIRDLLPSSLFSSHGEDVGSAAQEMSSFSYLLQALLSLIGLRIGDTAASLATICGLLLLSSVFSAFQAAFRNEQIAKAFSALSSLAILCSILVQGYVGISAITSYFSSLNALTTALIPLMGVLYAMGGNVTAAVASSSGLSIYLTVMEQLIGKSILPFCGIVMAFALMNALEPTIRLGTLSATIKKNYTTFLAFLMMLLSAMLAAQAILGSGSDSLAMRSAKFAAGNMIPVVGGSVSELLRTVSASVSYLRGAVGICAMIILLLTLFPTLIELFLIRLSWQLSASLADMLGCDREKKLLDEMASLNGYLITSVAICSSVVVLALSLLIHCATALGS